MPTWTTEGSIDLNFCTYRKKVADADGAVTEEEEGSGSGCDPSLTFNLAQSGFFDNVMKVSYTTTSSGLTQADLDAVFSDDFVENVVVGATSDDDGKALSLALTLNEDDGAFVVMTTMTSLVLGLAAMAF